MKLFIAMIFLTLSMIVLGLVEGHAVEECIEVGNTKEECMIITYGGR